MDSRKFFLFTIDKNDENCESYFMRVFDITEDKKELVEDPVLLKDIFTYILVHNFDLKSFDLSDNATTRTHIEIHEKELVEKSANFIPKTLNHNGNDKTGMRTGIDAEVENYEKMIQSNDNEGTYSIDKAKESYKKLNNLQKTVVDTFVLNGNDKSSLCDNMNKKKSLCDEEYGYLLKLAQAQVLSSKESRKGKKEGGRKRLTDEERRFKMPCEICGKMFKKKNLRIHLAAHNGEKKFGCPKCPSKFKSQRGLNSHLNMHQGIKPFQCDVCAKAYLSDGALRCHKLDHEGRIHKCDVCGRTFPRKYSLTEHIRIHTGASKRFSCKFCGKLFGKPSRLKKHINICHKPYYAIIT